MYAKQLHNGLNVKGSGQLALVSTLSAGRAHHEADNTKACSSLAVLKKASHHYNSTYGTYRNTLSHLHCVFYKANFVKNLWYFSWNH